MVVDPVLATALISLASSLIANVIYDLIKYCVLKAVFAKDKDSKNK